jgi:hypothetical protein
MIEQWFNDDLQKVWKDHRYIVVTDAKGEGEFLLQYLPATARLLTTHDDWSELEARYQAESTYAQDRIVFYTRRKATALTYIQEYAQTSGLLVLDDMEAYIKNKIFAETGKNVDIPHDKLRLAARLSKGKPLKWWASIVDGISEPLPLEETLLDFLNAPTATREGMDETVWNVFRGEVYRLIGKPLMEQPTETLAQEVVNELFSTLLNNTVGDTLLRVYYQWTDSAAKAESLRRYVSNYTLPASADPMKAHPDHPFDVLDRQLMKQLSDALKRGEDTTAVVDYMTQRVRSPRAVAFKPEWLQCVVTLCTFCAKGLNRVHSYADYAVYYQTHLAPLDTCMRKLYVAWLNDEQTLRPLQEYYAALNKESLRQWFSIQEPYTPTQHDLVAQALADDKRTAVIVCDGLRLEIAEVIAAGITDQTIHLEKKTALAVLPSVTENGMSALFGCDAPTKNAQNRFQMLRKVCPEVSIMPLNQLHDGVTSRKLVLMYGDIDQVAEKKQLGGLKDINYYESELHDALLRLLRVGYEKVVLTTDHGFVITGILDEADKEPRPCGESVSVEERFILSLHPLTSDRLIEKEGKYFDSNYQYYAPTDKPFVTRGAYGYAHGGFTPQECIIPAYVFTTDRDDTALGIRIANKEALTAVTGNYFTVKLQAEDSGTDIFRQERKVKLMLFGGNAQISATLLTLRPGGEAHAEFEWISGVDKVVIADVETGAQIDACDLRRSSSRDIDGLF